MQHKGSVVRSKGNKVRRDKFATSKKTSENTKLPGIKNQERLPGPMAKQNPLSESTITEHRQHSQINNNSMIGGNSGSFQVEATHGLQKGTTPKKRHNYVKQPTVKPMVEGESISSMAQLSPGRSTKKDRMNQGSSAKGYFRPTQAVGSAIISGNGKQTTP